MAVYGIYFTIFLAATFCCSFAFPDGAPIIACETQYPQHAVEPQSPDTSPYSVDYSDNGDGSYQVRVFRSSDNEFETFRGVFLQARSELTGNVPLGMFMNVDEDAGIMKYRPCASGSHLDNGVTHANSAILKDSIEVTWQAGADSAVEGVYFMASVVQNFATFWVDLRTETIN